MRKMKKVLLTVLSVCTTAICALALTSCDFFTNFFAKECVHAWQVQVKTGAACMQYGAGTETCVLCGETRETTIAPLGHTMADGVCTVCGARESVGLGTVLVTDALYGGKPLYFGIDGIGSCTDKDLILPKEIDGLPVMRVHENAFKGNKEITSVYADIPTIGYGAFSDCVNLETISFSKNVTRVETGVLTNTAFYNTETYWTDDSLYLGDILLHSKAAGEYYVKSGTRLIADRAFSMGDGHTLTKVGLPESVECIGEGAFSYNVSLAEVAVGKSVQKIGLDILHETAYEKDKANWKNDGLYLGEYLLKIREMEQTEYVVEEGTRLIANSACTNHDTLTHLTLPKSLMYINEGAFTNCYRLVEVYNQSNIPLTAGANTPSGVELHALHIYKTAGERRSGVENNFILYKDGTEVSLVGYLGESNTVSIPEGVTKINRNAFARDFFLTSVTFPDSVKVIGEMAFMGCSLLKNVQFGQGLTEIERYAFEDCVMSSVVLPDGVEKVGYGAFSQNHALRSVYIPDSVYFLAEGVFANCAYLESVSFEDTTEWLITWALDIEWRSFEGYKDINECVELLARLTDEHARYTFLKWEYKEDFFPTPTEEEEETGKRKSLV